MEKVFPADVLAIIFAFAISEEKETCPQCQRPYYFMIAGRTAAAIRGTCTYWREAYTHSFLLPGITAPHVPWCVTPQQCVKRFSNALAERAKRTMRVFYVVPHVVADMVAAQAHVDENEQEIAAIELNRRL